MEIFVFRILSFQFVLIAFVALKSAVFRRPIKQFIPANVDGGDLFLLCTLSLSAAPKIDIHK